MSMTINANLVKTIPLLPSISLLPSRKIMGTIRNFLSSSTTNLLTEYSYGSKKNTQSQKNQKNIDSKLQSQIQVKETEKINKYLASTCPKYYVRLLL